MAIFSLGRWSWPRRGIGSSHANNFIREPFWIPVTSRSGIEVTEDLARQTSAVLCGMRVIAEGVSQVPLKLYREVNKNGRTVREPAREHPAYRLLADQPNDFMTSFTFRETLVSHAVLTGNGYATVARRSGDGTPLELLPVAPDKMKPVWDEPNRTLFYEYDGMRLPQSDVLHIKGPSWTGFTGMRAIQLAQEAIGLSVSLERSHADLFAKGGRPSGILTKKTSNLSPEAAKQMREDWQARFGPNGDGGIAILDGEWGYNGLAMSAVDAQYIETRKQQIEEVARFLRVFPQMLMQAEKTATYASAEQFFIAHVVHTLTPWFLRIEQEIKRVLIGYEGENADVYPRHSVEGLLRGASKDRSEFFSKALGSGGSPAWMTPNEIRELENLNPLEGGDYLARPLNSDPGDDGGNPDDNEDTDDAA